MPSWKKVLQSGSAVHILNITASGLPNTTQANVVGITSTGQFTYFSTSSLVGGGNNSIIGGSGNQNYITRWDGSTTITTSSIYENGGNIGIGTTSPQQKLHVSGGHVRISNNEDAFLEIIAGDSKNAYIDLVNSSSYNDYGLRLVREPNETSYLYHNGDADFGLHASGSANILFYTTALERMRITPAGNVGIGTSTPSAKLHVSGGDAIINGIDIGRGNGNIISNTRVGFSALSSVNLTGDYNTAVGIHSLIANTTGHSNTAIGGPSLANNTTGQYNTAVGVNSLNNNTTGQYNTAIGVSSLNKNTTGVDNTGLGTNALTNLSTGSDNIGIGESAGRYILGGSTDLTNSTQSIFIGNDTRANANNETNQIVIGYDATGLGSNTVVLGNSSITKTALRGNVGIGTTSPATKLEVYRLESGQANRQTYTDILTINANADNNPFSGHGGGILFKGETYRGTYNWGRIGMELTDDSVNTTGENMFFSVASTDTDNNPTRAMTIRYNGNVGIGTNNPTNKLQVEGGITAVNITASNLPQVSQPHILGYDTSSGRFTYFSTSSLVSSNGVTGTGTQNYITRWSGNTTITTSSIYESGSRIGIGTGAVLPTATLQILGTLSNGFQNAANGDYSHAEGYSTIANGEYSHTEGIYTTANGTASHAEGISTTANGDYSHAEGLSTLANGDYSHAEGFSTKANGDYSHAEGTYTIAEGHGQHVKGTLNTGSSSAFATIIGNGFFGPHGTPNTLRNLVEIKPTNNISDFYGPVRITRTSETAANLRNNPDALRDQNKAGIVYIGFQDLFNQPNRGASPPIAVKVNNTAAGANNYGTLRHPPPRIGNTSYYTLIRHPDNSQQGIMLNSGQISNPYNVINTGIFTDGAVTAQEIRSLGSSAISSTSDVRLKENIKGIDIETALRLIENVKPVSFNWKRPESGDNLDTITGKYDVGVIAQDVMKNGFDHLITIAENPLIKEHTDEEGNISKEGYEFGVSYVSMIPYHAAVIKHLLDEIKELKEEIKKLK